MPHTMLPLDGPMTQEAFRIVHKAMRKMKKVGIGQITMHNREYLVALKAYQKGFLLIRLHYAQELRNPKIRSGSKSL